MRGFVNRTVLVSIAVSLIPVASMPSASAGGDGNCVPIFNGAGEKTGYICDQSWSSAPSPSPSPAPVPDPGDADDDDDNDGAESGSSGGVVDPSGLNRDSSVEASGGGDGTPPPSCVERALARRGNLVDTVDDTGRSGVVYQRRCDDGTRQTVVRQGPAVNDNLGVPAAPPADPGELADELYGQMIVALPSPSVHVAPADLLEEDWAFVQVPAFFWIDEWIDLTSTLTVGAVSVTLTVLPVRVDIDLGNGDTISCVDPPAFPEGVDPTTFDGCEYIYRHSSAMAPNGESWPLKVSMVWSASWSSNVGAGGSFGEAYTTIERPLQVAESQAILVEG